MLIKAISILKEKTGFSRINDVKFRTVNTVSTNNENCKMKSVEAELRVYLKVCKILRILAMNLTCY
jgi:hypothetical protein